MNMEAAAWKAKYDILASGAESRHVEAAEAAVRAAAELSNATRVPFWEAVDAIAYLSGRFKNLESPNASDLPEMMQAIQDSRNASE